MAYSKCGIPSSVSIVDCLDNTVDIKVVLGSDGTNNKALHFEALITYDGTTPSLTNYAYRHISNGVYSDASGTKEYLQLSFKGLNQAAIQSIFGTAGTCTIKAIIRTVGEAGSNYYSDFTSVKSATFTWHGDPTMPIITAPKASGDTTGTFGYTVAWEPSTAGINNKIIGYKVGLYNVTKNELVTEATTTGLSYTFTQGFDYSYEYSFYVIPLCTYSVREIKAISGVLHILLLSKFGNDNFTITASDGNTIPSADLLGNKTYVDIGSGTVLKLSWVFNTLYGSNKVDYYSLFIGAQSTSTGNVTALFNDKIGNVNEFYITSDLLKQVNLSKYTLRGYLKAHSIYGETYSGVSDVFFYDIIKGCGTFTKVSDGYKQPIMKRALAFTKLNYLALTDTEGKALLDSEGKQLYVKSSRAQDNGSGWSLMQNFYSKNSSGYWKQSDIRYEVLIDTSGEIITDINNEPVYTL